MAILIGSFAAAPFKPPGKAELPARRISGFRGTVSCMAFSPNGRILASGGNKNVILWDFKSGKPLRTLRGDTSSIEQVAFSPNGRLLASCSDDCTARVYDVKTGRLLNLFFAPNHINCLCFADGGRELLTGDCNGTIRVFSLKADAEVAQFPRKDDCVTELMLGPKGRTVYSGADGAVRAWNLAARAYERTLVDHVGQICFMGMPTPSRVLVGDSSSTVRLLAAKKPRVVLLRRFKTSEVNGGAMSPRHRRVYICYDESVYRASPLALKFNKLPFVWLHVDPLNCLAISPNGRYLVGAEWEPSLEANRIKIWRLPARVAKH